MAQDVKYISNRTYGITADDNGKILSFGPGATSSSVGTFVIQFIPDGVSDYTVTVMGRVWGQAAKDVGAEFMPIPYRRCTLANVASDYAIVSDAVSGASLIQVPANWEVGLLVGATQGTCDIVSWPLQGTSNP